MVSSIYVRPDGEQLHDLAQLLAARQLEISLARTYGLPDAAQALATVVSGAAGGAVASRPRTPGDYAVLDGCPPSATATSPP